MVLVWNIRRFWNERGEVSWPPLLKDEMQADVVSKDIKHSSLLNSTVINTFICLLVQNVCLPYKIWEKCNIENHWK